MRPSDCILAFGIPMSEAEFQDAKDDAKRDFVRNCCPVWQVYDFDIISHFEEVTPHFQRLGVQIIRALSLTDLRDLFINNPGKTIILFSHWDDDSVEFFNGMAPSDAIVREVPSDFTGIIDLCVCHPTNLAVKLRKHLHPDALVKFTNKKNTPHKWLYFYWAVFTLLDESDMSYLDALRKSAEAFAEIQ